MRKEFFLGASDISFVSQPRCWTPSMNVLPILGGKAEPEEIRRIPMDTMVLIEFGDGISDHIEVENVRWVEIPRNGNRCNILIALKGSKVWGYMDKAEVWKIRRHQIGIFEELDNLQVRVRDTRRLQSKWKVEPWPQKFLEWLKC